MLAIYLLLVMLLCHYFCYAFIHQRILMRQQSLKMTDMISSLKYGCVQHAGVLVKNIEKSKDFYLNIFGCIDETYLRPTTLPYAGYY
jgi:hypothetical protein